MITKDQIIARLILMLSSKHEGAAITPETHFINDLNFDSLERVEFGMQVEDEFNITVPDDEFEKLMTVQQVAVAICEQMTRTGAAD
jgi:acyl carrier protein